MSPTDEDPMVSSNNTPDAAPDTVDVQDNGAEFSMSWRWYSSGDATIAILLGAAVFFAGWIFAVAQGSPGWATSLMLLSALFLAFHGLRQLVNRTRLELRPRELLVTCGPLPGNRDVRVHPFELQQLYVRRRPIGSRGSGSKNATTMYAYDVHAVVTTSEDDLLVARGVPTLEQAHFIEAQIERYLEITERPVKGSLVRPGSVEPESPIQPMYFQRNRPVVPPIVPGEHAQVPHQDLHDAVTEAPTSGLDPDEFPVISPDTA